MPTSEVFMCQGARDDRRMISSAQDEVDDFEDRNDAYAKSDRVRGFPKLLDTCKNAIVECAL